MKTKIGSILLIVAFFISFSALAQRPGDKNLRSQRGEIFMKRNFRAEVDREPFFTQEQREAVKEIRIETARQVQPLRNNLRELMARQKTLTTAREADMKAIDANIEEISGLRSEIAKIQVRQQQEIRSLLTEEQLLRFDQRKNRFHQRRSPAFRGERRNAPAPRWQGRG